jgi:hypothetical protein
MNCIPQRCDKLIKDNPVLEGTSISGQYTTVGTMLVNWFSIVGTDASIPGPLCCEIGTATATGGTICPGKIGLQGFREGVERHLRSQCRLCTSCIK